MTLTLTRPDDWHVHLRDGDALARTVPDTARVMGRAIVMPNLRPPVRTAQEARDYRDRILAHVPGGRDFRPLMTLFLPDATTPADIAEAGALDFIPACKLYPAGATTHSEAGVTSMDGLEPVLEAMADHGLILLVHGEVTDPAVDVFDREAEFIERVLSPLLREHPHLKVVLEHITTREAVELVRDGPETLAATITAHHLLFNRNDMLVGGIRPHYYCLPVLKRSSHQAALVEAATGGSPRFFLGTDSAPHSTATKESACGCAGSYTSHAALEMYATVFENAGALARLEAFASHHGPDFYGLPRNADTVTLVREPWSTPEILDFGDTTVTPLLGGESLPWRLEED